MGIGMPDIDFRGLTSRSFEQLVQALAVKFIATGVDIFGDGPDGGREATYRGAMNFPGEPANWDGYLVIQAKFRTKLTQDARDAAWLASELRSELEKFCDTARNLESPEYYIISSNVELSSVQSSGQGATVRQRGRSRKGGHEKLEAVFKEFAPRLNLKGWDIWHADKLRTLIDLSPELRRSFASWLTSSEIVFRILEDWPNKPKDFESALRRFIARDIRTKRGAGLHQAGHSSETETNLDDVFIDLPFRLMDGLPVDDLDVDPRDEGQIPRIVSFLVGKAGEKLDSATVERERRRASTTSTPRPDRYLILGGPGQGKSTVAQFLAQILRARWLHGSEGSHRITSEVSRIVSDVERRAKLERIDTSGPTRFPLQINLPAWADAISNRGADAGSRRMSLIDYASQHISDIANSSITSDDLRRWLGKHPWAVILDGLDEVPPTGNRAQVIGAISEFWDEVSNESADLLLVVTSRPQGYNDDLDPTLYTKLELSSLTPSIALRYADQLAIARIPDQGHRRRVQIALTDAAQNQTTARLMVSPLQVAIMLALIQERGEAPTDRWRLFSGYYEVIRNRERTKEGPISEVLRNRSRDIDSIHYLSGMILQAESECTGSAEAFFTEQRFKRLVGAYLAEQGNSGTALQSLTDQIVSASLQRLVFLRARIEGQIGFDVRSLQEFMAAAKLMAARPNSVVDRLRRIAPISHWRHVFQIAASKCFSVEDAAHYRDTIVTICEELSGMLSDQSSRAVSSGGRLAASLLEDGLAYDQPRYFCLLMMHALKLLDQGHEAISDRFVVICRREEVREAVTSAIVEALAGTDPVRRKSAWSLLLRLATPTERWAEDIAVAHWPEDIEERKAISVLCGVRPPTERIAQLLNECFKMIPPFLLRGKLIEQLHFNRRGREEDLLKWLPYMRPLFHFHRKPFQVEVPIFVGMPPLRIGACSIYSIQAGLAARELSVEFPQTNEWYPLKLIADFAKTPSKQQLALTLENLSNSWSDFERREFLASLMPWPLASTYCLATSKGDLLRLAKLAASGGFGDNGDWNTAESRLTRKGVTFEDLKIWESGQFFDSRISTIGAPALFLGSFYSLRKGEFFPPAMRLWRSIPAGPVRNQAGLLVRIAFEVNGTDLSSFADDLSDILLGHDDSANFHIELSVILRIIRAIQDQATRDRFLVKFDNMAKKSEIYYAGSYDAAFEYDESDLSFLCDLVQSHPSMRGLVCALLAAGERRLDALKECIRNLPSNTLVAQDGDPPSVLEAIGGLVSAFSPERLSPTAVAKLLVANHPSTVALRFLHNTPPDNLQDIMRRKEILLNLMVQLRGKESYGSNLALNSIKALLDRIRSNIASERIWKELGFEEYAVHLLQISIDAAEIN